MSLIWAERDQLLHADGALGALRLLWERHRGEGRDGGRAAAGLPRRGAGGYRALGLPRPPKNHRRGLRGYFPLGFQDEGLDLVFLGALLLW